MKRGETDQAIQAYVQVAEQFAKAGFDAKAVAIYKQILHIDASCLNAHVRLGDLFQRMGLTSDALREFQKGIQICEERELKREAFDLLKRVASLDPGNVPNRLRLANLFVRQDLQNESREEYASLLKEVLGREEPELIGRVCEQMLESFPESPEAVAGLGRAKIGLAEPDEAVDILNRALSRFPSDIGIREALVAAYEAAGDEAAVQRTYTEIAELYKARGDEDQARAILQRFVTLDQLAEPDTTPSIILSEVLEEQEGLSFDFESAPLEASEPQPAQDSDQAPEDLLAEARISFEFGDMAGAQGRLNQLLALEPRHTEAQELLAHIQGTPSSNLVPESNAPASIDEEDNSQPSLTSGTDELPDTGSVGEESLPDIELMLEDDQDRDAKFASVDPPRELQEAELEIDLDASDSFELEPTAPPQGQPTSTPDLAGESMRVSVDLEEAEFFFSHGMLDEAERAYREILNRAPQHPKAMLRMGEIVAAQGRASKPSAAPVPEPQPVASRTHKKQKAAAPVLSSSSGEDSFDLAAELESSPDDNLTALAGGGFEDVFRAFKREIQLQIGEDESEAHYDLAIAYKEMGLIDDAIAELAIVRRAGTMPIQSFAVLLANCELGLSRPSEASAVLEEALAGARGDEAVSLRYELGEALLAGGKRSQALDAFRKVAAVEPDHREVSARVEELG